MAEGISIGHTMFRQAIEKRLASIGRLCAQYNVPMVKHTLILRDPANDAMSIVLTNEDDTDEAFRIVQKLEGRDGRDSSEERRSIPCHFTFDERSMVGLEALRLYGVVVDEIPVVAPDGTTKTLYLPRLGAGTNGGR